MRRVTWGLWPLLGGLVGLGPMGCGDDGQGGAGGGTSGGSGGSSPCDSTGDPRALAFEDRTAEWSLGAITGPSASQGLAVADLDGDGYPDLVVHGFGERMPVGADPPFIRVLLNRPRDGGGRTFVDATSESGYPGLAADDPTSFRAAHHVVFGDVDNDGDLDALSGTFNGPGGTGPSTADRTKILLNDGAGVFTYAPDSDVSTDGPAAVASATFVDVDKDGALDVVESVWYSASGAGSRQPLLFGAGDGTFSDGAGAYGVDASAFRRPGFGSTACDLDGDGWPEVLIQSYGRQPNMLWRLTETGFVDEGVASGYAYDDDQDFGDDQVFLCWCQDNASDPRCRGAAAPMVACGAGLPTWVWGGSDSPENLGGNTFSTACGDVNNDGKMDLFTGEIAHWWAGSASDKTALLLADPGDGLTFTRPAREDLGIDWPHTSVDWDEGGLYTTMADLDNDTRLDLIVGASDYTDQYLMIFQQRSDGTFEDVAVAAGIQHPCASSPVVADFDRDGDLDLVVGGSLWRTFCNEAWGGDAETPGLPEVRLYENTTSDAGRGLAVRLVGDGASTNTTAIGARVTVRLGDTTLVREVDGGHGHGSMQDDTVVFFGLGACEQVDAIEVRWPNLAVDTSTIGATSRAALLEITQTGGTATVVLE